MWTRSVVSTVAGSLLALGLVGGQAPEAQACGGFFCAQVPIDQMGEQILFGMDDGEITAHIQITYTGAAEDFAWILPVAAKPVIDVGSQSVFTTLRQMTEPRWFLDWQFGDGQCGVFAFAEAASDGNAVDDDGGGSVTVVDQQEVGPYKTVTLESTDTDALIAWLNERGYDQPPEARPLIDHYVRQGMMFVAVRLGNDRDAGDIQPIVLKFAEPDPCVPLVLTQIAAMPDMPVRLWLLADHRVIPTNWMHVVINEKKIDWVNNGQNYTDVVTQAVNEAAGHGFVTEMAGSTDVADQQFWAEGRYDLSGLAGVTDPSDVVQQLLWAGLPRDATMQGILRDHIPMPQSVIDRGVEERDFYNNVEQYEAEMGADFEVDTAALLADIDEKIITPLREAQKLFDRHPYMTRLFTTVSPDEMTRDPLFAQNPDLGDVANQHSAKAEAVCDEENPEQISKVIITLESGEIFEVTGEITPWGGGVIDDPAPDEPAAKRIELVGRTGAGVVVDPSQAAAVDSALDLQAPEAVLADLGANVFPTTPTTPTTPNNPPVSRDTSGSGGCVAGGAGLPWILAVLMFGLLAVRRRRV